jgi:hypothetical protein
VPRHLKGSAVSVRRRVGVVVRVGVRWASRRVGVAVLMVRRVVRRVGVVVLMVRRVVRRVGVAVLMVRRVVRRVGVVVLMVRRVVRRVGGAVRRVRCRGVRRVGHPDVGLREDRRQDPLPACRVRRPWRRRSDRP